MRKEIKGGMKKDVIFKVLKGEAIDCVPSTTDGEKFPTRKCTWQTMLMEGESEVAYDLTIKDISYLTLNHVTYNYMKNSEHFFILKDLGCHYSSHDSDNTSSLSCNSISKKERKKTAWKEPRDLIK